MLDQRRRAAITLAKARAALPGQAGAVGLGLSTFWAEPALQLLAEPVGSVHLASQVVTDVDYGRAGRAGTEERIERRDAVGLGRRDGEPGADVIERARADPADPLLHGMQHGQQQVPPTPGGVAAKRAVTVGCRAQAAFPSAAGRPENRGDRGLLVLGRCDRGVKPQVH